MDTETLKRLLVMMGRGRSKGPQQGGQATGKVWTREDDLAVFGLEATLADGHKYCWDPAGIR